MAYCTAAELRSQIDKTSAVSDALLTTIIGMIEPLINNHLNRPDGFEADSVASARFYTGSGGTYQYISECVEITEVAMKDDPTDSTYTALAADDWIAFTGDPVMPDFNRTPYEAVMMTANGNYSHFTSGTFANRRGFRPMVVNKRGTPTVRVTAKWGYAVAVPADIKLCTIIQAGRAYKEGQGAYGDALANEDLGKLMYTKALHPTVREILDKGRYFRPATGAPR